MNSGHGLTGVLDPGLTAPIPGKVTGPSFWAAVSRTERREAGWVARLSWAACRNSWPAGLFAVEAGTSGGPELRQLGRAQKNNRWMGWADSRVSWVSAHPE
jgi:hypothetical protein